MMLYARSCERPSKSSASVFFPSSVSNRYSFSTGTHGSCRRCSVTLRPSAACSASSFASSSRAACHSSRVPVLCSGIVRLLRSFVSYGKRPTRWAELIAAWRYWSAPCRCRCKPTGRPHRMSFDMGGSHDLFVGDAGQELWEEVSITVKGGNYGWNVKEGTHCFSTANDLEELGSCPLVDSLGNALIDPVL